MKSERAKLQHRPFLTPIWLSALGAFLALSLAVFALWVWGTANSTTVVVITDPGQSTSKEARAALLTLMFGTSSAGHLDSIYVSSAQTSAEPLAAKLGIVPAITSMDDPKAMVHAVLAQNSGGRAMIVAKAGAVAQIVGLLAARNDIPAVDDEDFGVMYVVTVPRIGHANLLRLNY